MELEKLANEQSLLVDIPLIPLCPVRMQFGHPCCRPIHEALEGTDPEPVCLMHSKDPLKSVGELLATFLQEIESTLNAKGNRSADFSEFVFPKMVFDSRDFSSPCNFYGAVFSDEVSFYEAVFHRPAYFERSHFAKEANFRQSRFLHDADFYKTVFEHDACFAESQFERNVYFSSATFTGSADFHSAKFCKVARFRVTSFECEGMKPSPIFSLASFPQPHNVLFYNTNLSNALFMNCDVSRINFSKTTWRKRKRNQKRMLFEEELPLSNLYAEPLRAEGGDRDYSLIAETYQQLKKNFDNRGDYWKAGDFHYGEMEMQRLSVRPGREWLRFRRSWHPHLSFTAWYKYASAYGESFVRPLILILSVLALFTFVYPFIGLRLSSGPTPGSPTQLTYKSTWPSQSPLHDQLWAEAKLLGRSTITTLDTATFQRTTEYTPSYPWGRFAAILETLVTSSLFALFLLALRRQFRR
jgi:uncharacterized protein YjbI with pentapeptide repeats